MPKRFPPPSHACSVSGRVEQPIAGVLTQFPDECEDDHRPERQQDRRELAAAASPCAESCRATPARKFALPFNR